MPLLHRLFALWAALFLCMPALPAHAADKLPVLTSFSILADMVRVVGGDYVEVAAIVGPDADAHGFEVQPRHARALAASRLFVVNGLGFDPWAQRLAKASRYPGTVLVATTGISPRRADPGEDRDRDHDHDHSKAQAHAHEENTDPHAWQDPRNGIQYVRNIAAALERLDPAHAADFQRNAQAAVHALESLDAWTRAQLDALPVAQRKVITNHDAFGYFAERYQLRFLTPLGFSTATQASAQRVAALVRQIRREKARALFLENMDDARLLQQVAAETGLKPGGTLYSDALSAPGTPGATYLGMLRHNVQQLLAALQGP